MNELSIRRDDCTGCGACVATCPFGALTLTDGTVTVSEACTLCGACLSACPEGALSIARRQLEREEGQGVWVFAEQRGGQLAGVALELLGAGRRLADDLGQELAAVLFGHEISDLAPILFHHGADVVYAADSPLLASYQDEAYSYLLTDLIEQLRPEIVLYGATSTGRSLAPRVAARLKTGLTADCTGLEIDPETRLLYQTRPAFGGNIMATIKCRFKNPQMATVRPRVMKPLAPMPGRTGKLITVPVDETRIKVRTQLLEFIPEQTGDVSLEDADIIVSGGRGLKDPKNFAMLHELAGLLGGAVGASRAAVDAGWIDYRHQVGQTGKTVSPKVYIAVGISGAIQHLAGMQSADIIVAINKDPDAPIFNVATYGIVGDLFEVVPALLKELKLARPVGA